MLVSTYTTVSTRVAAKADSSVGADHAHVHVHLALQDGRPPAVSVHAYVDGAIAPRVSPSLQVGLSAPCAKGVATAPHSPTLPAYRPPSPARALVHEKAEAPEPSLPPRNRLGLVSQRIKPVLGNVARRGLRYGILAGCVLSGAAVMVAPILAPFFVVPAVAVGASVPLLLVAGALLGAVVESSARALRVRHVAVEDVRELEQIYLDLGARKKREGKLSGEDNMAWHKVNTMLEEMSGGFWRSVRLILAQQLHMKMRCGRYQVGSIFAETAGG